MQRVMLVNNLPESAQEFLPSPDKVLSGEPRQTIWVHYTDPSGQFVTGIWRCEPGKWKIAYTEEEFCHLTQGVSILTNEAGESITLQAGDSFVVPRGFTGTWEVVQTSTKRFVIYESNVDAQKAG